MKIKINNITYEIKYVDKIKHKGKICNGIIYYDPEVDNPNKFNTIEIANIGDKKHTLFHEIVHALLRQLEKKKPHLKRLADKCNNDENFVDGLALLMMDCFEVKQ